MATATKKVTTTNSTSASKSVNPTIENGWYIWQGFSGNDVIKGTNKRDKIYGNGGNDTITGNKGDDILNGGAGNNTFIFNTGDGKDTLERSTGNDTIRFMTNSNLSFVRNMANQNLIIQYGTGSVITVLDFYTNDAAYLSSPTNDTNNTHSLKNIINGTDTYTVKGAINQYGMTVLGTNNNDVIYGSNGNDTINGNDGRDSIYAFGGNDIIDGGAGNDIYFFDNTANSHSTILQGQGIDQINLVDSNSNFDVKFYRDMNNNDLVMRYGIGNTDNDIVLKDFYANGGHAVKNIRNGSLGDMSIGNAAYTYGLDITGTANNDSIYGDNAGDVINGGAGNDSITTFDGDDTIIGGTGNDTIDAGDGHNTYIFNTGDGNDVVKSYADCSIQFTENQNLRFSRNMNNTDLIISYGNNDSVTLKWFYQYNAPNHFYSNIEVKNGDTTQSLYNTLQQYGMDYYGNSGKDSVNGTAANDVIFGAGGNDMLYGGAGNDTIYGDDGNDILRGEAGDDYLYGGAGSDQLYGGAGDDVIDAGTGSNNRIGFYTGDGHDTIVNGSSTNDYVYFYYSNTPVRYSHDLSNNDLIINYGNGDSINLQDYYVNNSHSVTKIAKGSENLTVNNSINKYGIDLIGTSGNDTFNASLSVNTRIVDAAGNDNLVIAQNADSAAGVSILFNVDSTGNNLGDICVLSNNQISNWVNGSQFKGVVIENNAVENISNGSQHITSSDIAQLASDVAGWLNTNGFASVQDVLDSNNTTSINALIAEFQNNTNWQ